MSFWFFGSARAVLSSSLACQQMSTVRAKASAVSRTSGNRKASGGRWRRAMGTAVVAALAEAAVIAIGGLPVFPWPGLLQIGVGFALFISILVAAESQGAGEAARLLDECDDDNADRHRGS